MKRNNTLLAALACCAFFIASSCGLGTTDNAQQPTTASGSSQQTAASGAAAILGSIIGQVTNGLTTKSVVGTWVYSEPSVQFESDNLLAKAGGAVAAQTVVNKLTPYYKKLGITPGKFVLTFNQDGTCVVTANGQQHNGTYQYNSSANTLTISGTIFSFPTAYVTVGASNLAMTFDSSKLLSIAQGVASKSTDATISSIGTLASSFNGMKTGFSFTKK